LEISYREDEPRSVTSDSNSDPIFMRLANSNIKNRSIEGLFFNYNYSDQELPHLEVLAKFGSLLKYFEFEFEYGGKPTKLSSSSSHVKDMIEGLFLDHLFKHCTNLEHLFLSIWHLINCNPSMSKNYSITALTLSHARITTRVLYELSVRLVALKHLDVLISRYERKSLPFVKIDMSYTSLEFFKFSMAGQYKEINAGIRISTATEEDLFYTFRKPENINRGVLSESSWEVYKEISAIASKPRENETGDDEYISFKYLNIDVCCKTLKKLFIDLLRRFYKTLLLS
jgi:hypothetical protein